VTESGNELPRLFATKNFMRFARGFGSSPQELWDAVRAKPDADLGGGVFKFRLAREGEGTSGGVRAIVAMKVGRRVVLMYGFEKKDLREYPKERATSDFPRRRCPSWFERKC
jgi:hypothetical protein